MKKNIKKLIKEENDKRKKIIALIHRAIGFAGHEVKPRKESFAEKMAAQKKSRVLIERENDYIVFKVPVADMFIGSNYIPIPSSSKKRFLSMEIDSKTMVKALVKQKKEGHKHHLLSLLWQERL